ncbi:MAG: M12 family metallo-peptidase [Bacteroidota bacterium]
MPRFFLLFTLVLFLHGCTDCDDERSNPENDPGIELINQARAFMCGFEDSEANRDSANNITNLRMIIHDLETKVTYMPPQNTWPFQPSGDFDVNLFRVFDSDVAAELRQKKQELWAAINSRYNTFGVNSIPPQFSDFCRKTSAPGHIIGRSQLSSMKYNVDSPSLGSNAYVGYTNTIFDWVDTWERHKEPLESFLRNINLWERLPVALGSQSPVLESFLSHQRPIWELANPQMFNDLKNIIIPTVDVLVLYTPETLTTLGSNPEASIQQVINLQNEIFRNSRVFGRVRLAGTMEIFDPTNDLETLGTTLSIRNWIRNSLGTDVYRIKENREDFNADIVSIWVQLNGMNSFGSAAQDVLSPNICSQNLRESAHDNFFNVIIAAKAANRFHFAHELGHNLALSHDAQAGPPNAPTYSTGQGYILSALSPDKRTIMAYATGCQEFAPPSSAKNWDDCERIPHYSNPNVNFSGFPTGNTTNANAAGVLKESLRFVSDYNQEL